VSVEQLPAAAVVLPADGRSPGTARAHVRAFLAAHGLLALADDALLLVTELVTNAVVHAGTECELRLAADGAGLHVEVVDYSPGVTPVVRAEADSGREGGRGLFLLDALSEEWGTAHARDRKSVWFLLGAERARRRQVSAPALAARVDDHVPPALGWLLALPDDLEQRLSPRQVLTELLHRHLRSVFEHDPDTWSVAAYRGDEPDQQGVADERRQVLGEDAAFTTSRDRTVVVLRGRGAPFGALVLEVGPLDAAATAVARLAAERLAMVLRDDRADMAQRRQRGSLALLAEASDLFAGTLDVQLTVTLTAQMVVPRLAAWAAVYSFVDDGVRLSAVAHQDEERIAALRVALSTSCGTALAERMSRDLAVQRPVLVGQAELAALLEGQAQGDVLALPLVARRRLLGGLLVARGPGSTYSAEEVSLLLDLARRAALAIDNARLYEERTAIAHALQASLLPPELPTPDDVEFGARYHPAGEGNEVGGDFYDVFSLPDRAWAVAIGDVCGKGAEAAAITGLARNVVRLLLREGHTPSQALSRLNDAVLELGDRGRFCTAALAVVRPAPDEPGALDVLFSSGGHPPPVLVSTAGRPAFVGSSGTVLGVLEAPGLADEQFRLRAGETLLMYTDGVTERRRGRQMFGEETLLRVVASAPRLSADAVAGLVEREVRDFAREAARDDLAVLVVRATGRDARAAVATTGTAVGTL
jgi:serine phosphatase RsbU (regulator of sigma subunit)/anti-sigma regulatory factor (Ser/Thr protein kinase)